MRRALPIIFAILAPIASAAELRTTSHSIATPKGYDVHGVLTVPADARGPMPALFFVGWLSCDSMTYADGRETDGYSKFILRTIRSSGFAAFRIDKPGVGASKGPPCRSLDFQEELAAYQAAFRYAIQLPEIDPSRVVIVGLSNGGGFAPLVAQGHRVAGYVSIGGWGRTWLEHMIELERSRLELSGVPAARVNTQMKLFAEFYVRYLTRGETPGQIIVADPRFKPVWYDAPDGQYGRPAAFFQQLQDLNLEAAWSGVDVPVLVVRGAFDWIMSQKDAEAIAAAVNRTSPGKARLMIRPRMDHFLDLHARYANSMNDDHASFDEGLVGEVTAWLKMRGR